MIDSGKIKITNDGKIIMQFSNYHHVIDSDTELCYKHQVDKVIAELKAQKAQTEDDCAYWKTVAKKNMDDNVVMARQRAKAFESERHHKYKRCLAMAKWCRTSARYDEGLGAFKYRDWYWKWFKRWLKLAEKFKEAK